MACGGTFDVDHRAAEVKELEGRMAEPGFWDRPEVAQRTVAALKNAKRAVENWNARDAALRNLEEMLDIAEGDESLLSEIAEELGRVETQISELELKSLLSGEHDQLGALVSIHP